MSDLSPLSLPPSTYTSDLSSSLTEHLQWYGPNKLHPTHLGDTLANGRYRIAHKLDHCNHSLSWLARDTATHTWRRVDVVHGSPEVSAQHSRAAKAQLGERAGDRKADERGLAMDTFTEPGPNGVHVCVVFPLNGRGNCFRWEVRDECRMNEAWFVRQCGRLRARQQRGAAAMPESVHDIKEDEMVAILGRPRVIEVTEELRKLAVVSEQITARQVPRYLVVRPRPEGIKDDVDF